MNYVKFTIIYIMSIPVQSEALPAVWEFFLLANEGKAMVE